MASRRPTAQRESNGNGIVAATNSLLGMGKMGDLKRRLLFLLGALIVFRIGSFIPVPGIDPNELARLFQQTRGGILDMFNMFSGGALSRFSIFALDAAMVTP